MRVESVDVLAGQRALRLGENGVLVDPPFAGYAMG